MVDVFEVGDLVSDGIYLSDKRGMVISVNKSYSQIIGIQADEIVGKNMQRILEEKYLTGEYVLLILESLNKEITKSSANKKESFITEKPLAICSMVLEHKREISVMGTLSNNGKSKKIHFMGKPYFNSKGEVTHVLNVIRETTELIKLKEKLEN
ncbi:PAS domain S-box protein [Clostridium sp.]